MSRAPCKPRILVVEDEESIRDGVCDVLAYHGYAPTGVDTGELGLERGQRSECDLVVLDLMLPGLSGFDVCQQLRQTRPSVPILILTAKGSEEDVLEGFRRGADDYVTKPFSIRELVARVGALLRRTGSPAREQAFRFGPWQVEPNELRASAEDGAGGGDIELTPREVALLALFAREAGRVVSRRALLQEVWGMNNVDAITTRTVDVHIAKLRKKIDRQDGSLIETVRGAGYRPLP